MGCVGAGKMSAKSDGDGEFEGCRGFVVEDLPALLFCRFLVVGVLEFTSAVLCRSSERLIENSPTSLL
jgi:hypothetical protein